jgi:phosphoglycerol transferase MdoB-like AlkP superfamily enzyme
MQQNWQNIIEIMLDEARGFVAAKFVKDFNLTPSMMATTLMVLFNKFIDSIPEQHQRDAEQMVLEIFNFSVDKRFEYINVEKHEHS